MKDAQEHAATVRHSHFSDTIKGMGAHLFVDGRGALWIQPAMSV